VLASRPRPGYTIEVSRPVLSFAVFLLVSLAVLGGMHAYLWVRLVRDPGLADPWRRLATVLLVLLALSVPVGMFAVRLGTGWVARLLPVLAFTWLGAAFLLVCAVGALDVARVAAQGLTIVLDWMRTTPDAPDPGRRAFMARAVAGGAVLAAGGATALSFRTATGPAEITEVPVRLARLPKALSGLTIAQITDLHVGPTIREREVRRVVEQTNALRPDVIAITGDLVDGSVRELGPAVAHLASLRARHGVFFVTGNHEYYSGVGEWVRELGRMGIRVLRNERVAIGDGGASLDLAGVDDWSAGRLGGGHGARLESALAGRDPERSLVLLAHQPRGVPEAIAAGVELQVSGHTHGGQIFPFNFLVAAAYPYLKGLYAHEEAGRRGHVYVSRGTGYWGPPMRLGSPPEIAKIVLTT
jgi:predicted MPP superfamily phosphohydrolase